MEPGVRTSLPPQSQLRWACAELARRLRAGEDARAEQWFATLPILSEDADLAVELIYTEYCTREELGQTPQVDEFCDRFPRWHDALQRQFEIHELLSGGDGVAAEVAAAEEVKGEGRVGPFVVQRELGRGGMGVVYEARHATLGRVVALKMVAPRVAGRSELMARLLAEAQTVASLRHPNIVQLYEIGEAEDGRTFLAFEFLEAGNLARRIGGKPQDPRYAAGIIQQLARAAADAHRAGVVHCDLTPGNILFTHDGSPKIADFGLARLWHGDHAGEGATELAGTPSYMAPEQIDDPQSVGPPADVYALGAVLYEMLTGRPPLLAATPMETMLQVRTVEPVSPRELRPSLRRDLATICLKCLAKDPRRRYLGAAELAEDLRRFLAGEPILGRSVGTLERGWKWSRRHPALALAVTVATLALGTVLVGGWTYSARLEHMLGVTTAQEQAIRRAAGDLKSELDRSERNLFTMQLMQVESLIDRNPAQAIAMLDDLQRCPPRLRDFAWGLFRRRATQDEQTLRGHEAAVLAVTTIDDGQQIVSVGADRTVRWFDIKAGSISRTMTFEVDAIGAVALAHDGSQLAVGDGRGVVRVWSLNETASDVKAFEPLSSEVVALAWSVDHQRLAAAGGDGEIRCWKIGGPSWTEPAGDLTSVLTLAFSNDGQRLASGGADGAVRLWNAADGTPLDSFSGHAGGARAIAFSADDKSLAVASQWEPRIDWWNIASRQHTSFETRGQPAQAIATTPDGSRLVTALADRSLRVFTLPGGEPLIEYRGHTGPIHQLTIDNAGAMAVTAAGDETVKRWDLRRPPTPMVIAGDPHKTLASSWSQDSRYLATGGHEGVVRLWDQIAQKDAGRLVGHSGAVRTLRFDRDHRRVLSTSEDGTFRVWTLADRSEALAVSHPARMVDARWDDDRNEIVTLGSDGQLRRWNAAGGELIDDVMLVDDSIVLGVISDDCRRVAMTTIAGETEYWNGEQRLKVLGSDQQATALAFSSDRTLLAIGLSDRSIVVWDIKHSQVRHTLAGHTQLVSSIAFCRDGQTLVSGAGSTALFSSGEVKLWNLATGQAHATLPGYGGPVAIDPADSILAVTDHSGRSVAIWSAASYRKAP